MIEQKRHPVDRAHHETAEKIIAMIETDGLRWTKRWATASPAMNGASGRPYSGSNILTTGIQMMHLGVKDPRFITFKQALELGGCVTAGEKSIPILSFSVREVENDDGETRRWRSGRVYRLFHISQCDGIDVDSLAPLSPPPDPDPRVRNPRIDALVVGYLMREGIIMRDAPSAFYTRQEDKIGMPPIEAFIPGEGASAEEHYYSTLLHEMIHSTGVAKRLNRDCYIKYHGSKIERAREELIAEIGSVLMGQSLGLQTEPREDNAAYVKSWITLLQDRPKAIFDAASAAQAAANFIAGEITQAQKEAA